MSDAIVSECPSAAICYVATNWWNDSTSTASTSILPATSASNFVAQHAKKGGITVGAALVYVLFFHTVFTYLFHSQGGFLPNISPCVSRVAYSINFLRLGLLHLTNRF